jgi:predicted ATPase/DNA-binding SARP family transcriptional activator/Tfp pilus assembly protein PilF
VVRSYPPGKSFSLEELEPNLIGVTVVVLAVNFMGSVLVGEIADPLGFGAGVALPFMAWPCSSARTRWISVLTKQPETQKIETVLGQGELQVRDDRRRGEGAHREAVEVLNGLEQDSTPKQACGLAGVRPKPLPLRVEQGIMVQPGTDLRIVTLGGLSITYGGAPLGGLASRKAEALLVYLACQRRPQPRDLLADLLWDDAPSERARGNLNVLLSSLRQQLGPYLLSDRLTAAFNSEAPYWFDAQELEQGFSEAAFSTHAALDEEQAARVEACLAHYRGDFLQGFVIRNATQFEQWVVASQEHCRRLVTRARRALLERAVTVGAYRAGIAHAHALLAVDPYDEGTREQLLRMLAASGQRAAALAHYAEFRQQLARELNTSPGEPLSTLFQQIRSGAFPPPAVSTIALASPVTVERAAERAVPLAFAAPPAHPGVRNAPFQPTSFIGRRAELEQIAVSLADPACRLLTLLGPGGVGKTRLALEAAALANPDFADGVIFVPLAGVAQPELLPDAIAAALEFRFAGRNDPRDQLIAFLRNKQLLLVLDNFEHLDGAAEQLNTLLHQAPRLRMMVTSRRLLQLSAEWTCTITGLDCPPAAQGPTETLVWQGLEEYSAVRLFVQRAQRARIDFALTTDQLPAVVQICRLVEGLPLAIELAAAWVRTMSCTQIAAELAHNLDLLSTRLVDVPERHRSARAVFEQSWRLLSIEEQNALARLSICRGGFTLDAARAMLTTDGSAGRGDEHALSIVSRLIETSLVRQSSPVRYEIHELVRQFAATGLSADEMARLQACHSAYYLDFVRDQQPALYGREPLQALAAFRADLDNVREAWATAVRTGDSHRIGRALAGLRRYCDMVGLLHEGAALFAAAQTRLRDTAATTGAPEDRLLLAELLLAQARIHSKLTHYDQSSQLVAEAVMLAQATESPRIEAFARCQLGTSLLIQGRRDEASEQLDQALALARSAGEPLAEAEALQAQAIIAHNRGVIAEARALWQRALALYRAAGDRMWEGLVLNNLSVAAYATGDYQEAERRMAQALALHEATGDLQGQPYTLNNLGSLARVRGDYGLARSRFEGALAICEQIGDQIGRALVLGNLGDLALARGDYAAAAPIFEQALGLARIGEDTMREAYVLGSLAQLHQRTGAHQSAREVAEQGLHVAQRAGLVIEEARARLILGHILAAMGHAAEAEAAYSESARLRLASGEAKSVIEPQAGLARLALNAGDQANALALVEAILPLLDDDLAIEDAFRVYLACYEILDAVGDARSAAVLDRARALVAAISARFESDTARARFLASLPAPLATPHLA